MPLNSISMTWTSRVTYQFRNRNWSWLPTSSSVQPKSKQPAPSTKADSSAPLPSFTSIQPVRILQTSFMKELLKNQKKAAEQPWEEETGSGVTERHVFSTVIRTSGLSTCAGSSRRLKLISILSLKREYSQEYSSPFSMSREPFLRIWGQATGATSGIPTALQAGSCSIRRWHEWMLVSVMKEKNSPYGTDTHSDSEKAGAQPITRRVAQTPAPLRRTGSPFGLHLVAEL